jgi:hypothetical protein
MGPKRSPKKLSIKLALALDAAKVSSKLANAIFFKSRDTNPSNV